MSVKGELKNAEVERPRLMKLPVACGARGFSADRWAGTGSRIGVLDRELNECVGKRTR